MYEDFLFRAGEQVSILKEYHKTPDDDGVWLVDCIGRFGTIIVCRISKGNRYLSISQRCLQAVRN
jgi:hypothetical protein